MKSQMYWLMSLVETACLAHLNQVYIGCLENTVLPKSNSAWSAEHLRSNYGFLTCSLSNNKILTMLLVSSEHRF